MPYSKMVEDLAIIDGVAYSSVHKDNIAELLVQLEREYPEDQQQIGDATAAALKELRDSNIRGSIVDILRAMVTVSEAQSGISYYDAVTAYLVLRKNGMS